MSYFPVFKSRMGSVWLAGHPLGTQKRSDFSPGVLDARLGDFGINGPTNQRSNRSGTTFLTSGFVHDKGRYHSRSKHESALASRIADSAFERHWCLIAVTRHTFRALPPHRRNGNMRYEISQLRRTWLAKEEVVNSLSAYEFLASLRPPAT
jgi:hypothetical protein